MNVSFAYVQKCRGEVIEAQTNGRKSCFGIHRINGHFERSN